MAAVHGYYLFSLCNKGGCGVAVHGADFCQSSTLYLDVEPCISVFDFGKGMNVETQYKPLCETAICIQKVFAILK